MRQQTQIELTQQIFAHLDAGTTALSDAITENPVTAYTCPERLRKEQEMLFRAEPILMALSCDLPNPNDYLTDDNCGVPILLLRDAAGTVRAFVNTCKHRGARLLDGRGTARRRIVCPYHAWSYDLDGKLAVVPHKENFVGFDIASCRLSELPVAEKDGFIWVRPGGGAAIDADAHLAGLSDEFESYGLGRYHHYQTRRIECEMNWKIIIDTFLEPYHFATLHTATVAPIFFPNLCLFDAFGRNLRETLPRRTIVEQRETPPQTWDLIRHTAMVYVLYPNTVFVMQADHAEVWRVFPRHDRPDQSVVHLQFYTPEPVETDSARGHWERNLDLAVRTVEQEDFPVGEGSQVSYASGALETVVYGLNEPALAYFQKMIATGVGDAL